MRLTNPEVRIETTNACNAACVICPRDRMTRTVTTMPYYHFEELVWQSHWLGANEISTFGYGEPLLDKGLPQKVALCNMIGMKTNLTTNASLLTPELSKKLLKAGLKSIRFSCHGWGDNYNMVHRGLNWTKVIANIAEFMKINDSVFNHQCAVNVSVIPMNGENLEDIIQRWEPAGQYGQKMRVDHLEVWKPHNWAGAKRYRRIVPRKKTCGRPWNGPVQINADGKMMVCCFDFDAKMTVGDTYRDSIEDILKGEAFERIREAHRTGNHEGLPCATCDQLNIESESPLLYSTVDPSCEVGKTSSTKFKLKE